VQETKRANENYEPNTDDPGADHKTSGKQARNRENETGWRALLARMRNRTKIGWRGGKSRAEIEVWWQTKTRAGTAIGTEKQIEKTRCALAPGPKIENGPGTETESLAWPRADAEI
jgi:hypothetical protein